MMSWLWTDLIEERIVHLSLPTQRLDFIEQAVQRHVLKWSIFISLGAFCSSWTWNAAVNTQRLTVFIQPYWKCCQVQRRKVRPPCIQWLAVHKLSLSIGDGWVTGSFHWVWILCAGDEAVFDVGIGAWPEPICLPSCGLWFVSISPMGLFSSESNQTPSKSSGRCNTLSKVHSVAWERDLSQSK